MSDLQDLIHKTSMDCLERGKQIERERIIKLLEEDYESQDGIIWAEGHLQDLIELIKGETK
jgi:hypothetical protein